MMAFRVSRSGQSGDRQSARSRSGHPWSVRVGLTLVGVGAMGVAACRSLARRLSSSATDGRWSWIIVECAGDVERAARVFRHERARSIPGPSSLGRHLWAVISGTPGSAVPACHCRVQRLSLSLRLLSFELEFSTSSSIPIETAASHRSRRNPRCFASTSSHRDRACIEISRGRPARTLASSRRHRHVGDAMPRRPETRDHRGSRCRCLRSRCLCLRSRCPAAALSSDGAKHWFQSARFQTVVRHSTDGALAAPANALRV
jgi:hypothetical protein